jgi:hypothetical protein
MNKLEEVLTSKRMKSPNAKGKTANISDEDPGSPDSIKKKPLQGDAADDNDDDQDNEEEGSVVGADSEE